MMRTDVTERADEQCAVHEKLMDASCIDFARALADKQSVPGGGGAAAYAGALGMALGSMVANFTTGKPKYAECEADIQRILKEGEDIRVRLIALVDKDAENFYPLSQAYGIPKEDPARGEILEACTKTALAAPYDMMKEICRAIQLLEELLVKGSKMLLSDVGCGAALSKAALECAALNVLINTKALNDRKYAESIEVACASMLAEYAPRAQAIVDDVMMSVRS